jgi:hypothetical protein
MLFNMELIEVRSQQQESQFLDVARNIYKDDPHWVCPFDAEINAIFNPSENTFFQHGSAIRWILRRDDEIIGRVAAFVNRNKAFGYEVPTGGMGFFECVDNHEAAFILFDACRKWLINQGMKAMDGPVNFGENDNYWGLLVDGFTHPGYGMPYHKPYYRALFESYGFQVYFEQITNHLDLTVPIPGRFMKIAEWVLKKKQFTYRHFNFKEADGFLSDFKRVYDQAWQFHENFTPIEIENLRKTFHSAKSIIDPELIWFAYHDNEPIGFEIIFPDINQIVKPFKGKLNLFNKLRLLAGVKLHRYNRGRMIIMGIVPRYQRFGIDAGIIYHLHQAILKKPWLKELELSWVGDFNPKMQALQVATGSVYAKKHVTYRISFEAENRLRRSVVI